MCLLTVRMVVRDSKSRYERMRVWSSAGSERKWVKVVGCILLGDVDERDEEKK